LAIITFLLHVSVKLFVPTKDGVSIKNIPQSPFYYLLPLDKLKEAD